MQFLLVIAVVEMVIIKDDGGLPLFCRWEEIEVLTAMQVEHKVAVLYQTTVMTIVGPHDPIVSPLETVIVSVQQELPMAG
jgi:hypothetical protein